MAKPRIATTHKSAGATSHSVVVATAYMDEAQRFDWLMAMDDGKIIAHGTLQELLDKAGEPTLDEAFIALMPEEKRALH
mgnify:CR=1 FL=1